MLESSQKYKLGLFVIAGAILMVVSVIVLAGRQFGRQEYPAFTFLEESVQGLEVGAPVKYRGVPVGQVKNILLDAPRGAVRIDMELYEGGIAFDSDRTIVDYLEEKIKTGVRCRLELTGITGLKYVEIDRFPEVTGPGAAVKPPADAKGLYIPANRSLLVDVTTSFTQTLAELRQVNFAEIGGSVNELLTNLNTHIGDEKFADMMEALRKTSESASKGMEDIRALVTKLDRQTDEMALGELSQQARQTLREYESLPADLRKSVQRMTQVVEDLQLRQTISRVQKTLDELNSALARMNGLPGDVEDTVEELNRTLVPLRTMLETLEEDPGALLRGKQQPPVTMGKEQ